MQGNEDLMSKIINEPTKLSREQQDAVLSETRYNRIIAGAGAGKTETLTRRIAYLILIKDVNPSSIVAFTFTERAAQNMKSRIYQRVGELDKNKLKRLGEMYIGTIHSYAKRVLDDYFRFGNYTVLDENQEFAFLMRNGWDIGIDKFGNNYFESCMAFIRTVNMVWNEMLSIKELEKSAPDFCEKLEHYKFLLDKHKLITFGSMITLAVNELRENPNTLNHIRYLIVDEYQDINKAQEEFIRLVGSNGEIFIVGDPRQTIYRWRGSDESFFHSFENVFNNTKTIIIKENRRSGIKIVKNANKFAESLSNKYDNMEATRMEDGFIGLIAHDTPEDEATWIADRIEELIKEYGLNYSDIGILTRSVRSSADILIDILKERRIPYIVGGKIGLFKRDEAQALGRIFAWLADDGFWVDDPWDWGKRITGDDLLTTALEYWGRVYQYEIPHDVNSKLNIIKTNLNSKHMSYNNFTNIYQDVLVALGFKSLTHTDPTDSVIMANLGRFNSLLTDYETANRIGGRTPKWKEDLKGLCWFMNSYAMRFYEEQSAEDIIGVDAVQIMTVHQAKGLEWPVVFLFSLNDGIFPSKMIGNELNWCGIPRDVFDAKRYEGDLEDERKLFYVAITRARDILILSYFRRKKYRQKRSRFLNDLDHSIIIQLKNNNSVRHPVKKVEIPLNMLTLSATEVTLYLRCPYMFLLRNVYGYQPGLTEAIDFGKGVHYCLRRTVERLKKDSDLGPLSAAARSVDQDFFMLFARGEVYENYKKGARRALVNYAKKYGNDLKESNEVEYRIEFPIQNATVTGRIDILGNNNEVRDYKTLDYNDTKNSSIMQEIELQVKLYAAGLKSAGRNANKGSIAFLNSDGAVVVPVDINDQNIDKAVKKAENVVTNIRKKQFDALPAEHCDSCDMKNICRWRC
ncbi:MAG: ATP-dependent DNA helicase [Candidatus Nitrosocaldaceae archaeon]